MAQIVKKFLTLNPYFNDGRWISGGDLKGFTLHSVGCSQPDPLVFWRNWNRSNYYNAGINGFIGEDVIYITASCLDTKGKVKRMPHGGKAYANDHYIGFEMCEPSQIFYTSGANFSIMNKTAAVAYVKKTYANAVDLFARLCAFHGKDPLASGVIMSHNELGKKGLGTTHVDPEHLWKGLGLSYTMDGFRRDVKAAMGGASTKPESNDPASDVGQMYRVRKSWGDAASQIGAFRNFASAAELADKNPGFKVYDNDGDQVHPVKEQASGEGYLVRVTASVLNIRAGAGTGYKVTGTIRKGGVFTIVEEKNGWGKLKSGAGWISLSYTVKV